jgi:photosystem II stability/assembly factor-like uncharacterized protein
MHFPKIFIYLIGAMFVSGFISPIGETEPIWHDRTGELPTSRLRGVTLIGPKGHSVMVSTDQGSLYTSDDLGNHWRPLRVGSHLGEEIYDLARDPTYEKRWWAGTNTGLISSDLHGERAQTVLIGSQALGRVKSIAFNHIGIQSRIYAATAQGLFFSDSGGKLWSRVNGSIGQLSVQRVAVHRDNPRIVFAIAEGAVWRSVDRAEHWQRRRFLNLDKSVSEADTPVETPTVIGFGYQNSHLVYVGSSRGLWASEDLGDSWRAIPLKGVLSPQIQTLAVLEAHDHAVIIGTDQGAYLGDTREGTWTELYQGMIARDIREIVIQKGELNRLWAATDNGLFSIASPELLAYRLTRAPIHAEQTEWSARQLLRTFSDEPTILEVQEAAISYAQVHPGKIEKWHRQAQWAALMPDIHLGWDTDDNIELDRGGTQDPDTFIFGPEERSWDVSLNWDLAKLIWNDDQTSIDTRSRLLVQLRDQILDQVNRIYFERRRLQTELLLGEEAPFTKRLERELRLSELTARLDGLTGGIYSAEEKN